MVGVYEDEEQAKNIVIKLQDAGFNEEQIGVLIHKGGLMTPRIREELVTIGITDEEATIYERAFEDGSILVLVRHNGRLLEAFTSLYNIVLTDITVTNESADVHKDAPNSSLKTNGIEFQSQNKDEFKLWKLLKDAGFDHLL